jgi:adenine phosphoribosyltransferase
MPFPDLDPVRAAIRDVPDFPQPGVMFKDITPVLSSPDLFRRVVDHFVARYRPLRLDALVIIDARGFILGAPVALELGVSAVPVRKRGKLPYRTVEVEYDLEYGRSALALHEDALRPGARVAILDDVLATGGTARAAVDLVRRLGADVVECAFLIELAFLGGRARLGDVPAHAPLVYT